MSAGASKERLQNSRVQPEFWWFHGKDLKGFFKEVQERGAENLRILVTPGLDEEGTPDLHLSLVAEGATMRNGNGSYNESHICPPDC